jgi:hypothetical protein
MVRVLPLGMAPLLLDVKVEPVPETHETDVELVLRQ